MDESLTGNDYHVMVCDYMQRQNHTDGTTEQLSLENEETCLAWVSIARCEAFRSNTVYAGNTVDSVPGKINTKKKAGKPMYNCWVYDKDSRTNAEIRVTNMNAKWKNWTKGEAEH